MNNEPEGEEARVREISGEGRQRDEELDLKAPGKRPRGPKAGEGKTKFPSLPLCHCI
jgi:hypothetical protein